MATTSELGGRTMAMGELDRVLSQKVEALRKAEGATVWRFYQGDVAGGERPDLNDREWQEVQMPITWTGAAGDVWLRQAFRFPEYIEGISTQGARIELPLLVPMHSTVYVDGKEQVAEPSWLDTRAVPLVLTENYQPGQALHVAMHAFQGDGFGLYIVRNVEISSLEDVVFRLDVLRHQMGFCHYLAFEGPTASAEWQEAWTRAHSALDLTALAASRWDTWWQSAAAARDALAPMAREAKRHTSHLVGHSHIDMNWLWTWAETEDVICRDFEAVDSLVERYDDFHFSHSQAATYRAIEEDYPELLERVKRRVAQGNWEVTASTWVEGDLNLQCGESLVRHFMLTRPYIEGLFGVRPRILWEPDTFGHVGTLPQLMKQVGVDYYYFCRAGKGQPLFWWEGIDGSRVLAFNDPLGYNGVVEPSVASVPVLDLARRYGLKRGLFLYGVGDHGGGATARDIERARELDKTPFLPHTQMSDLLSFYTAAEKEATDLPVIRGELNTTFEGCYTSHSDIKMLNRQGENALLSAESLAAMADILADTPYPLEALDEGWRNVLFHHFHDILCGCAIGATYRDAAQALAPTLETAAAIACQSVDRLAGQVDTGTGEGPRCVVWNPLAWERTDLVRLTEDAFGETPAALVDDAGNAVPVQVSEGELLFVAHDVPALGCRVYRPAEALASSESAATATDDGTLRNALLSLHVNEHSGAIDVLLDLEHDRVVDPMARWRGVERKVNAGVINRLQVLWEQPHPMSAWNIGDITRIDSLLDGATVRVVERGPVRATIEVEHKLLNSSITQRYRLYAGMRRVDVETELDWHERGGRDVDAPMLRATFKPGLGSSTAAFEVAFAGLERPATGDEVPGLRWSDISDAEYGFSVLNNGKYGHQAHGNTLGLTLVRSSYEPDNLPDQGLQSFTYALYPHAGDWRAASTDRRAAEFNQPLQVAMTDTHPGQVRAGAALLTCDPANVMVSAVKWAQSGERALIVRLVEMHGQPADARVQWSLDVQRVERVNPLEDRISELPCRPDGCELPMFSHEIATIKLVLS
ncbi:MAG: alpha-mannosidase [Anaerolineae bacterium]